jgi:hypothetical protein
LSEVGIGGRDVNFFKNEFIESFSEENEHELDIRDIQGEDG